MSGSHRVEPVLVFVMGAALAAPFLLFGLGLVGIPIFVGGLIFSMYLLLFMINFELGFLILLFFRSSMDYIKNFTQSDFNLAGFVSLILIVLGVFYVMFRKVDVLKMEDSGPFLLFLGITAGSVFYSGELKESFSDWLRLVSVFSVYLLTRIIFVSERKIVFALKAILLSSLIPIFLSYYQLFTGNGTVLDAGQERIVGTFLHPNAFASYLLILLIFSLPQIFEKDRFMSKRFMMSFFAFTFLSFIFTFSRGAWLVFLFSTGLLGLVRYRKILVFLPLVLLVVILLIPGITERIENIFDPGYTHGRSAWDWRVDTWEQIMPLIKQRPVFGNGLATVETQFNILAHNDYLRLLAETGLLGFLAYMLLMGRLLFSSIKRYVQATSPPRKALLIGLIALVTGFLIREFADNTLRNTVVMIYFWAFIGLLRNMDALMQNKDVQASSNFASSSVEKNLISAS